MRQHAPSPSALYVPLTTGIERPLAGDQVAAAASSRVGLCMTTPLPSIPHPSIPFRQSLTPPYHSVTPSPLHTTWGAAYVVALAYLRVAGRLGGSRRAAGGRDAGAGAHRSPRVRREARHSRAVGGRAREGRSRTSPRRRRAGRWRSARETPGEGEAAARPAGEREGGGRRKGLSLCV